MTNLKNIEIDSIDMIISLTENTELHHKLFFNPFDYDKWAPHIKEFQVSLCDKCHSIPAYFNGADTLFVNDEVKPEFLEWVNNKMSAE